MATENWPLTLPQAFQQNGYTEGEYNNVVKSKMNTGPDKRRLRCSVSYLPVGGKMILSNAQKSTFYDFFKNNISYGAVPFNFPDPNNPSSIIEVYLDSKKISAKSGTSWDLTMTLKALF